MSESIRDKYLNNPIPELEKFMGKVYDGQIEVTFKKIKQGFSVTCSGEELFFYHQKWL